MRNEIEEERGFRVAETGVEAVLDAIWPATDMLSVNGTRLLRRSVKLKRALHLTAPGATTAARTRLRLGREGGRIGATLQTKIALGEGVSREIALGKATGKDGLADLAARFGVAACAIAKERLTLSYKYRRGSDSTVRASRVKLTLDRIRAVDLAAGAPVEGPVLWQFECEGERSWPFASELFATDLRPWLTSTECPVALDWASFLERQGLGGAVQAPPFVLAGLSGREIAALADGVLSAAFDTDHGHAVPLPWDPADTQSAA
ncbi:MAG: hypothetical protein AAFX62_15560 [Pseudomonadota bacterium]